MTLKGDPSIEGSDYINASFITVSNKLVAMYTYFYISDYFQGYSDTKYAFIAAQGLMLRM